MQAKFDSLQDKLKDQHKIQLLQVETSVRQEFLSKAGLSSKQQFYYFFDKWRLLTVIQSLQYKENDRVIY
jgi:hypothetical protein